MKMEICRSARFADQRRVTVALQTKLALNATVRSGRSTAIAYSFMNVGCRWWTGRSARQLSLLASVSSWPEEPDDLGFRLVKKLPFECGDSHTALRWLVQETAPTHWKSAAGICSSAATCRKPRRRCRVRPESASSFLIRAIWSALIGLLQLRDRVGRVSCAHQFPVFCRTA